MEDVWIFEKPKETKLTGRLVYWFEPEEIEEYDFRFETKYVDCREEAAGHQTDEPNF